MRDFLEQIEAALGANLYYMALFASLCLADMCGALGSENGRATGSKYAAWFNKYVDPKYTGAGGQHLTGKQCYQFRCSLLHQGSSQNPISKYSRYLFIEPAAERGIILHNNVLNDALNIDVRIFCSDVIEGVLGWLTEVEGTRTFERNNARFMKRHPDALHPYVTGVPVIA